MDSEHAKRALGEAVDLARTQDARLTLLTVAAPLRVWPGYVPPVTEVDLVSAAEEILSEGKALLPDGIPVSGRAVPGDPGLELVKRGVSRGSRSDRDGLAVRSARLSSAPSLTSSSITRRCPCSSSTTAAESPENRRILLVELRDEQFVGAAYLVR